MAAQVLWRSARARVLAHQGRLEEAEGLAAEAVEIAETSDTLNDSADALVEFTEVLLVSGKRDKARPALTWALGLYERKGMLLPLPQHETMDEVHTAVGSDHVSN